MLEARLLTREEIESTFSFLKKALSKNPNDLQQVFYAESFQQILLGRWDMTVGVGKPGGVFGIFENNELRVTTSAVSWNSYPYWTLGGITGITNNQWSLVPLLIQHVILQMELAKYYTFYFSKPVVHPADKEGNRIRTRLFMMGVQDRYDIVVEDYPSEQSSWEVYKSIAGTYPKMAVFRASLKNELRPFVACGV